MFCIVVLLGSLVLRINLHAIIFTGCWILILIFENLR